MVVNAGLQHQMVRIEVTFECSASAPGLIRCNGCPRPSAMRMVVRPLAGVGGGPLCKTSDVSRRSSLSAAVAGIVLHMPRLGTAPRRERSASGMGATRGSAGIKLFTETSCGWVEPGWSPALPLSTSGGHTAKAARTGKTTLIRKNFAPDFAACEHREDRLATPPFNCLCDETVGFFPRKAARCVTPR
jgi:hypothetical protein